jgi:hypothetical protein
MTTKIILFSFLISFVLVFVYTVFIHIINAIIGGDLLSPPAALQKPLSLPWIVLDNFAPDSLQYALLSSPMLRIFLFAGNVILYAIPIFLILKLWRKRA